MEKNNWQNRWMGEYKDIQKNNLTLLKQNINILKEDMEECHWAMFTHAMDFFKEHTSMKNTNSKTSFHKFIQWFVNRRFSNPWELTINIIHETQKQLYVTLSKQA